MMKTLYKYAILITLSLSSCTKYLETEIPVGKLINEQVFNSEELTEAALRGMYATMINGFAASKPFQNDLTTIFSLTSDEYVLGAYSTQQQSYFDNNNGNLGNIPLNLWATYYSIIVQANMIKEGVEKSPSLSTKVKQKAVAEALFTRALCFFYLTNIFNEVPLTLTSDYEANAIMGKSTQAVIYNQIVQDLLYAQENLVGNKTAAGSRSRPSQWTASALLARVYLYQKNWAAAEETATKVINQNTIYKLEDLEKMFQTTSNELIWELRNTSSLFVTDVNTVQGPITANSVYRLSDYTLSRFDANDQRKIKWTKTIAGTTAQYKFKTYNNNTGSVAESNSLFRLAEQYLIRAEARARQTGKLASAIQDLDVLRTRAGAVADNIGVNASNTFKTIGFSNPSINQADLIKVIYDERIRELFGEYGHRWFDALRSGIDLYTFFEGRKPLITNASAYFPISQTEIDRNPNLK